MSSARAWLPYALAMLLFLGIAASVPPLMIRAVVAAQRRIGNGAHPRVAWLARHRFPVARSMWAVWALGALVALPAMARDVAREHEASVGEPLGAAAAAAITTPAPGTPPYEGIVEAVRARLGVTSRLAVGHIAMTATDGVYAFVRATELVPVAEPDGEQQETDLAVMALLELPSGGAERTWRVVELWTLPGESARPRRDFVRRVRAKQARARLPESLFPPDL